MTFRILLYVSLTSLVAAGSAWGQTSAANGGVDVAIGYQGLPVKIPGESRGGVQIGEGSLLHIGVGAEAGFDSNVFYGETNTRSSALVRIVPFLELTNAGRGGAVPSDLFYDLGASLTYREYLSNDLLIRQQRAFMPSAYGNLEFGRIQTVGFGLAESFSRTEDPPYLNTANLQTFVRDVNQASARLRWAPGGGRLGMNLSYTNTIDWFETDNLRVANSMGHVLMLDTSWKWLPKTALVLQVSQGYVSYFNAAPDGSSKPRSFPFHALGGIRGLITSKLTLNLLVGYGNGFYDTVRPGPSGFRGNVTAGGDIAYRATVLTTLGLGYRHDFQNAILGDFYYLDAVYLNLAQAIAGRLGFGFSARYESRSFQNIPLANGILANRHDNYWQVGANLDYHMRDWTYAGVAYTLTSNSSDYQQLSPQDPGRVNYVKQVFFARLGVTY
jgi:hypothetical protein